ncbi:hypothetical protein [Neobacillus niacini]|uniref:hypothetical protein n=1 Tax=Neobacillus niacini TaxID=86668 RepID=UPI0021CB7058|nr:hypothetical protein [Neobacillus niacini]MCM3765587.1 hypothetical protein [Neobacillus niacini]
MSLETNLFDMWKDFYSKSTNMFDERITENFPSQGIAQVMEMNLMFKKMIDESTEKYLELVNIPSRNDLASLSSMIVNVDAKVDNLEELLEESSANQPHVASLQEEMVSIKKDIKSLENKVNQILALLKASEGSN